jgi:hypothetical protein
MYIALGPLGESYKDLSIMERKYNLAGWLFLLSVGRSFVGWTRCLIFWWCMEKENTHTRIHFVGGAVQSQWKKWKERKIGTAGGRHFGKQKER